MLSVSPDERARLENGSGLLSVADSPYTIRPSRNRGFNKFWGDHSWRVFDEKHAVSIGFATYEQAERCRDVLIADDRRRDVRQPPAAA